MKAGSAERRGTRSTLFSGSIRSATRSSAGRRRSPGFPPPSFACGTERPGWISWPGSAGGWALPPFETSVWTWTVRALRWSPGPTTIRATTRSMSGSLSPPAGGDRSLHRAPQRSQAGPPLAGPVEEVELHARLGAGLGHDDLVIDHGGAQHRLGELLRAAGELHERGRALLVLQDLLRRRGEDADLGGGRIGSEHPGPLDVLGRNELLPELGALRHGLGGRAVLEPLLERGLVGEDPVRQREGGLLVPRGDGFVDLLEELLQVVGAV